MKPLTTEIEVWRYLARRWARILKTWKRGSSGTHYGICFQMYRLSGLGYITFDLQRLCENTLERYRGNHFIETSYFWRLTKRGAKHREALCREFAGMKRRSAK